MAKPGLRQVEDQGIPIHAALDLVDESEQRGTVQPVEDICNRPRRGLHRPPPFRVGEAGGRGGVLDPP